MRESVSRSGTAEGRWTESRAQGGEVEGGQRDLVRLWSTSCRIPSSTVETIAAESPAGTPRGQGAVWSRDSMTSLCWDMLVAASAS